MFPYLIWLTCMNAAPGQPNQACNKALQAAYVMSGVQEKDKALVSYAEGYARKNVPQDVGGAAAVAYQVAVKKQLTVNFVVSNVADDIAVTGSERSFQVGLTWHF